MTLFVKKVFADVIKSQNLKAKSFWLSGRVLNPMTSVLVRDTPRKGQERPCVDRSGDGAMLPQSRPTEDLRAGGG